MAHIPTELTILRARHGGFMVYEFFTNSEDMARPLYAGNLPDCLRFIEQTFKTPEDKAWETMEMLNAYYQSNE